MDSSNLTVYVYRQMGQVTMEWPRTETAVATRKVWSGGTQWHLEQRVLGRWMDSTEIAALMADLELRGPSL